MSAEAKSALSIHSLFADRDALRRREKEQEEQLKQRQQEELTVFRKRLETFEVTDENRQNAIERIKRAFERGETELMLTSFPSSFCTDDGRAVINAGAPPINKPNPKEQLWRRRNQHGWQQCRPACARSMISGSGNCSPVASSSVRGSSIIQAACQEMSGCSCHGPRVPWTSPLSQRNEPGGCTRGRIP